MKMYAYGWKKYDNIYTIQLNDVKQGDKAEIKKVFKDWSESGFGWNVKDGNKLLFFSKPFNDQKDWLAWAKECPIKITEIRARSDKEEYIELNYKTKKKRAKNDRQENNKESIKEAIKEATTRRSGRISIRATG